MRYEDVMNHANDLLHQRAVPNPHAEVRYLRRSAEPNPATPLSQVVEPPRLSRTCGRSVDEIVKSLLPKPEALEMDLRS